MVPIGTTHPALGQDLLQSKLWEKLLQRAPHDRMHQQQPKTRLAVCMWRWIGRLTCNVGPAVEGVGSLGVREEGRVAAKHCGAEVTPVAGGEGEERGRERCVRQGRQAGRQAGKQLSGRESLSCCSSSGGDMR